MPINCPLEIRALTAEQFQEVDYRVMGHAYASQNELGRLCEEGVYQRDLRTRLLSDGFRDVQIEVPITVSFEDFSKVYLVDLAADNTVYELKTTATLTGEHQSQLLNYLFLLGMPRGKLITFRSAKVQGQIHATRLTPERRASSYVDTTRWTPLSDCCGMLLRTVQDVLADWGAFLDYRLYEQALTHFCGGEAEVIQRLPLCRSGNSLGSQRFHVHAPWVAFRVTAVTRQISEMESQLRRLVALTELRGLQWINFNHADIELVTLTK